LAGLREDTQGSNSVVMMIQRETAGTERNHGFGGVEGRYTGEQLCCYDDPA
jgi:hypothetical protein